MAGLAAQRDAQARKTVDRGHHADRQASGFEHRPLLDVQLGVGEQLVLPQGDRGNGGRIEAEILERAADGGTLGILRIEHPGVERAGERTAAEHGRAEAHAFLVAEAHHLDGKGQPLLFAIQQIDAFDGGDYAEHAVVLAGIAHRVEVRAEHEAGQSRPRALVAPARVADRVEPRLHAGLAHPAEHQLARRARLRRKEHAGQTCGKLGMPRERIAALQDARRVEHARECTLARVELAELNALGEREFVALLGGVFERSPWVAQRAFAARPFASVDDLHEAMMSVVRAAGRRQQLALVRAHPELAGAEAGAGTLTVDSSSEQARLGFTRLAKEEFLRMAQLNQRYREKHGFPCIVALRLHATRDSVMKEMETRVAHATDAELRTALEQIGHITRARLAKWAG